MSGVLKNALDWASRPAFNSPLRNKTCLPMTSSPGYVGGARAHAQINETLSSALARVVVRPQVVIAGVMQKIAGGRLVDEDTIQFCLAAIDDLLKEVRSDVSTGIVTGRHVRRLYRRTGHAAPYAAG